MRAIPCALLPQWIGSARGELPLAADDDNRDDRIACFQLAPALGAGGHLFGCGRQRHGAAALHVLEIDLLAGSTDKVPIRVDVGADADQLILYSRVRLGGL